MGRGRQQELDDEARQEAAALVARLNAPPWKLSFNSIGTRAAEAVSRRDAFTGEAVRQAKLGFSGADLLAALRALTASLDGQAETGIADEAPTDATADQRWRRRAGRDPAFRAVATRARGLAGSDRDRRLVETALDIAHDELPKNYGGLSVGEAQRAYDRALAFVRGEVDTPSLEPDAPTQEAPPVATPKLADGIAAARAKVKPKSIRRP